MENWKVLNSENQLEEIKELSFKIPVVLFKDSISCGISAHAKHKLESAWDFDPKDLVFFYLDLLSYRNISNKIAEVFGVTHQSPQILVIKNGVSVSNFSHQAISVDRIKKEIF